MSWLQKRLAQTAEYLRKGTTGKQPSKIESSLGGKYRARHLSDRLNGVGLPASSRDDAEEEIGLHAMAYRVRLIGGSHAISQSFW